MKEEIIIKKWKRLVDKWGIEHDICIEYFENVMEKELSVEAIEPFIDWNGQ